MNQSSLMVGYLMIGFIIFITMRGEIPFYRDVIGI